MTRTWTILEVLDWTKKHFESKAIQSARIDAEVLLASTLGMERVMLYAHFDRPLAADELARLRAVVARRARREPIAYILQEREFWSLPFHTTADVLIPRPETETLVEIALELAPRGRPARIADVGTGTGCIAIALAKELASSEVVAFDISSAACQIAKQNAERHGVSERVTILESDLLSAPFSMRGSLDLVCANLPYIPRDEVAHLMPDVRDFEPMLALDGGPDGLDLVRRLIDEATTALASGGAIVLELHPPQTDTVQGLLSAAGFATPHAREDGRGQPRIVYARLP